MAAGAFGSARNYGTAPLSPRVIQTRLGTTIEYTPCGKWFETRVLVVCLA